MSLTITQLDEQPFHRVRALNARRGGGRESISIPFLRGEVEGLPSGLDALVVTGDLQSVSTSFELIGVHVANELAKMFPRDRLGVILTGDLFSVPDASSRGGFGDVSEVWRAFQSMSRWVTGVAGNHDDVSKVNALDVSHVEHDGLRIGGVGLICGTPSKPGRRAEVDQLAAIELVSSEAPDVLVLHEGPLGEADQPGNALIQHAASLTVCGHVHWQRPLFRHERGAVLNVDGRVVVLTRASSRRSRTSQHPSTRS